MSDRRVGAVLRCGDLVSKVYDSLRSLLLATTPPHALAIVADHATPASADAWLESLAASHQGTFVRVGSHRPGASWNAGLRAVGPVEFGLCLEAGDVLARNAVEKLTRLLDSDETAVLATCAVELVGPLSHRSFEPLRAKSPVDLLADPNAVHVSSLFRWSAWASGGGFDEEMPALEFTDFWLRLLAGGGGLALEDEPLLRRRADGAALYRRTWATEEYRSGVEQLYARHAALAEANVATLLEAKERTLAREHQRHQATLTWIGETEADTGDLERQRAGAIAGVPADFNATVDLGAFDRSTPLSYDWGYDRGTPADRPLIERYLSDHAADIRGVVLEIQENDYTRRFGGTRVEHGDVLDIAAGNQRATLIGDLRNMPHVRSDSYDCIILTQTLHVIDDPRAVLRECDRILKPGGVLLATMPCASRVCLEYGPEADFWRVTEAGARRLFSEAFPPWTVETTGLGNPLVQTAFTFGLASEELPAVSYVVHDPYHPALIGIRVRKPARGDRSAIQSSRSASRLDVVLMYHRVGAADVDPHRLTVSEARFAHQLEWMQAQCSVVPLDAIGTRAAAGDGRPRLALTFDDGYADALSIVSAHLRRASFAATFFLTTADGEAPYRYWWDRLAVALLGGVVPSSIDLDLPSGQQRFSTATAAGQKNAHAIVYRDIVRLPAAERDAFVREIEAWSGSAPLRESDRRLTWAEVRELAAMPSVSIGAHTVNHLYLPAHPDDVLRRELTECRATLQRVTGQRVDTLAYPFGAFDARTVSAAGDAGFRLAVTCETGGVTDATDPLMLPRIEVTDEPLDVFIARIERASQVDA